MKHEILKLIIILISVYSLTVNARVYLDVERYKDSGLPSFVTSCETKKECYKRFQYAVKTGKIAYCKKITMIENSKTIWQIDFTKNRVWHNRQERLIWGD